MGVDPSLTSRPPAPFLGAPCPFPIAGSGVATVEPRGWLAARWRAKEEGVDYKQRRKGSGASPGFGAKALQASGERERERDPFPGSKNCGRPSSKMSLWSLVCDMPREQFNGYTEEFPQSLRDFLGDWLENQPWEFITGSDAFYAFMADSLLSAMVERLQDLAEKNGQPASILPLIANLENTYRRDPLQLAGIMKQILEGEQVAVQNKFQRLPLSFRCQQEERKFGFDLKRLQYKLQQIQALHRSLRDSLGGTLQINALDPQFSARGNLQANSLQTLRALLPEVTKELEAAKTQLLKRLDIWKRQQQLAGNGTPFDEDLAPLQKRFESLAEICFQLRPLVVAFAPELGSELQSRLQECLENVFNVLIRSAFLVDKQPPQVLKTQTKFQATVRFLLGPLLFKPPHTSYSVMASIATEKQARELAAGHPDTSLSESTGEIVNNISPLETNVTSNSCCAIFKNMLLKKIKRSDRKSTESVTEEKCAILFSSRLNLGSNQTTFLLQAISLPIVVIVHGNQDNNAKATILWDNAFAEKDRIPFVVTDHVAWGRMCETLNQKFMAEVQTTKGLLREHYFFLAQKIFNDNNASFEDFQNRTVSWAQFNKEILPGRGFTFWQWFEGVLDLTKKYLRDYWSDRLIMGFASKQYVSSCLSSAPLGTFLLRFSDSVIGGISIAYFTVGQDGCPQVENIQPLTAPELSIRSLADCVLDLPQLEMLHPNRPKHEAFRNHINTEVPKKNNKEYVQTQMRITVGIPPAPPAPGAFGSMHNLSGNLGIPTDPVYAEFSPMMPSQVVSHTSLPLSSTRYESPMLLHSPLPLNSEWISQGNVSSLDPAESQLLPPDVAMDVGLPDLHLPGPVDYLMQLDPMAPENLPAPSHYELDQLLHSEQHLFPYSHSPGPTLTHLCS